MTEHHIKWDLNRQIPWGLFDMHGNVWEWCWDTDRPGLGNELAVDPVYVDEHFSKVARGGSWFNTADLCRSAFRAGIPDYFTDSAVGFRVVINSLE